MTFFFLLPSTFLAPFGLNSVRGKGGGVVGEFRGSWCRKA